MAALSEASIDRVFVLFSDPWPKKRQRKHRLLSQAFFDELVHFLKPGSAFYFKTDHSEYFESVFELLQNDGKYVIEAVTRDLYSSEFLEGNIETEFESLFHHQGIKINFLKINTIKLEKNE